ncbi:biotin--[acetyl-CoA-carboxylase] ligase [Bacteroidia bacterium]|nr:biotin--[acetyl-CoA-carboxylase] ligase [Bacteroidia bacterium]
MNHTLRLIQLDTVDSTNTYAKQHILSGKAQHNDVIIAQTQTHGRGQNQNQWIAESGQNLTFSIVITPKNILPNQQFLISQAVAVGIAEYLKANISTQTVTIKWPNDHYVDLNKICGTLIENSIFGNTLTYSIIGIGLNVNQTHYAENVPNPISLQSITGKIYDLHSELNNLLQFIFDRLEQLYNGHLEALQSEYLQNLLFLNQWRHYIYNTMTIEAQITGITEYGLLQIKDKSGSVFSVNNKELVYLF